jgi:hypothetical protein
MITKLVNLDETRPRIKCMLSPEQRYLLVPVGDVHFGSEDWPEEKFLEDIRWAYDRGAYFIGMGDMLDVTPESQRRHALPMRSDTKEIFGNDARAKAARLAEMIRFTRGRWLGMLEGNHRWEFQDGTTSDQLLCRLLGCDFLGTMAMVRVVMEEFHPEGDLVVVLHHGTGGAGSTVGGQLSKPEFLLKWVGADLILMGHSHAKLVGNIDRLHLSPDGKVYSRPTMVARTGAFLKAYAAKDPLPLDEPAYLSRGNYVEEKAMLPNSMGSICFSVGAERIEDSKYWRPVLHYRV